MWKVSFMFEVDYFKVRQELAYLLQVMASGELVSGWIVNYVASFVSYVHSKLRFCCVCCSMFF